MNDIENQLRDACESSGMNMLAISNEAGVPYSAVHGFIVNNRRLSLRSGAKIAKVLGLELRPIRARRKGK